jgi:hypothetical protein
VIKSTITGATPLRIDGFFEIEIVGSVYGSPVGTLSKLCFSLCYPIGISLGVVSSPSSIITLIGVTIGGPIRVA